jgi:hypothetical protein
MKKIIILIIGFKMLTAAAAYAQDKDQNPYILYIKVYGGYSLFTPGADLQPAFYGDNNENNVESFAGGSFKSSRLGAGAGLNYGFGLATPIDKLWTVGIDLNNLPGQTRNFSQNGQDNTVITQSAKHSVLSVIPNITYKALVMPKYFIYTRLGIMVAVNTKSDFNYNSTSTDIGNSSETDKLTYGTNLGLQGAAGVQYKLNTRMSVFGEFTGNFLTARAKTRVSHQVNSNGDGTTDVDNYNITYLKSGSGTANRTITTTTSGNVTTTTFNEQDPPELEHINNLMLNVGVVFGFK